MVENRPLLTILTHLILVAGLIIVLFPIYIAFVASTHLTEDVISSVQPWFGGQLIENYRTVLQSGKEAKKMMVPEHLFLCPSIRVGP